MAGIAPQPCGAAVMRRAGLSHATSLLILRLIGGAAWAADATMSKSMAAAESNP